MDSRTMLDAVETYHSTEVEVLDDISASDPPMTSKSVKLQDLTDAVSRIYENTEIRRSITKTTTIPKGGNNG